ncbi:glycosyltransferase [Blastococcus jejuensis]|uniref:Glycosyltransferase n=1 Tax=Blastococcus jejuensis TaxID=351224 RepID=A0ABP6PJP4_9ACTN
MSRLRVLWLAKGLGRGGAEKLLVSCARTLDASRFEVEVAYLLPQKDALVGELAEAGIPAHCLGLRRGFDPSWAWRLRRLVRQRGYDVVHTHMPVPAVAARLLLWPDSPRLVHTEHNTWQRYRWPTYAANLATYARNDHVIAVSQAVADSIEMRRVPHLRAAPPVEVLVHGIDLDTPRDAGARARARGLLGLAPDAPVVGTVGNLTAKKDQVTMLRAVQSLRVAHPALRLVIIGTGPLQKALERETQELGLADVVLFTGMRDDVADLLPAFDIFGLTSRFEGLPIALLEALSAGLPAVVTAVGGTPEVITDEQEGLLVSPGSPQAFADAVHRLLTDDRLRRRLSLAALARSESFDIRRATRRIEEIYEAA